MSGLDSYELSFVLSSFAVQMVLVVYFALRRWAFDSAMRVGWLVYALALPVGASGFILWLGGQPWYMWAAGALFTLWACFGFAVEYAFKIEWRTPPQWPIFIPYVTLYLASLMFFWWPLGLILRPLWFLYAALFAISTALNVTSHRRRGQLVSGTG